MTDEEIEKLYPEFEKWWRKEKSYLTVDGVYLIKLWYEWLEERADEIRSLSGAEERLM